MATETSRFDAAEYLTSPSRIAAYLTAAIEEAESAGDIAEALGTVARARGMSAMSEATNLGRGTLYKALSANGNPTLATVFDVMKTLGLRLAVEPIDGETVAEAA